MKVSKAALIEDLKSLSEKSTNGVVTRNFYRSNGHFSEAQWQKHFSKFEDFAAEAGVNQPHEVSSIEGNKWSVFIPNTSLCSADEVMFHCKVDTTVWELERFRAKDISKDEEPKFQISAFFKKKKNALAIAKEIDTLRFLAQSQSVAPEKPANDSGSSSGNMLEVNIPDVHFGKLCWPVETGHEPYDIKIASAMYMRAVRSLIERTKGTEYEQVLYVIGNDMLNADDLEGRTTSGTMVTNDARYHKVFDVVRTTVIWAIEELKAVAPVKVVVVAGNHDQLSSWHLGDSVQAYFHADKDVIVDNVPCQRKYHEFGKVMLAFTHGDKGNRADYPLMMATEQPEMFGRTKFREMHTGHLHFTKVDEHHGVRVRILPALCPSDDWHSENGYFGNLRTAEAYTWNRKEGLIGMAFYNDDAQPGISTEYTLKYSN